jgi:hypothetical protein
LLEIFRSVTRAAREMRERSATTKELANTLRTIADELHGEANLKIVSLLLPARGLGYGNECW